MRISVTGARKFELTGPSLAVLAFFAMASNAATPTSVYAQTAPSSVTDQKLSGDIVVTATRRATSLNDVPYNLSVVSSEALSDAGIQSLEKLANFVPGLAFQNKGTRDNGANNQFIIRGINAENSGSPDIPGNSASPVSTYLDDAPIFTNFRLYDLAQIEVLRGPQGTLYGSGSLGGTIRFITNRPDPSKFDAALKGGASYTEDANGANPEVEGMINIPITDTLAFRSSFSYAGVGGLISAPNRYILDADGVPVLADPTDPLTSGPVTRSEDNVDRAYVVSARQALLWSPTDSFETQLRYFYQHDDADGRTADTFGQPGYREYEQGTVLGESLSRDVHLVDLSAAYDFGFAKLTGNLSAVDISADGVSDFTGYFKGALGDFYGNIPRLYVPAALRTSQEDKVFEARLASNKPLFGRVDWLIGVYASKQDRSYDETDTGRGIGGAIGDVSVDERLYEDSIRTRFEDFALFTEETWHITDKWQVTGGARFFHQKFRYNETSKFPFCGAACANDQLDPEGASTVGGSKSFSSSIFKANTSYKFNSDLNFYATLSEGFRRGGANGVPTSGNFAESPVFQTYDPDRTTNYEVGLKGRFGDGFTYSAAAYQIDWQDVQVQVTTPNGGYLAIVNLGEAFSRGVELAVTMQPVEKLDISVGYTYADSKLDEETTIGGVVGRKGSRLPGTPEHSLTVSADYAMQLANEWMLTPHIDASYRSGVTGAIDADSPDYYELPGYTIYNAALTLEHREWTARFFVDNIGNERGESSLRTISTYGVDGALTWIARPRTIGVTLGYQY